MCRIKNHENDGRRIFFVAGDLPQRSKNAEKSKMRKGREEFLWKKKDENEACFVPENDLPDRAIHRSSVMRLTSIAKDIHVDSVTMAQSVLPYNVVNVGQFFNKGSWVSEAWKKEHPDDFLDDPKTLQKECCPWKNEENS